MCRCIVDHIVNKPTEDVSVELKPYLSLFGLIFLDTRAREGLMKIRTAWMERYCKDGPAIVRHVRAGLRTGE